MAGAGIVMRCGEYEHPLLCFRDVQACWHGSAGALMLTALEMNLARQVTEQHAIGHQLWWRRCEAGESQQRRNDESVASGNSRKGGVNVQSAASQQAVGF